MMRIVQRIVAPLLSGALVATAGSARAADAKSYPNKPITLVVQASAGGGSDIFARGIAAAIEKHKLLPQIVAVENKPGGSGAVAFAYVAGKKGDPYYLLNASASFLATPLMGRSPVNYKSFTPIASLAYDEFVLFVKADSKYKTAQDIITAAKAKPKTVMAGGSMLGASDSICVYMMEKSGGVKFNYITFPGGSDVNTAILGGHVDFGVGNPGDALELAKAGKVRLLGVFSEKRLRQAPDLPTMKEQGIDAVFMQGRGIVAPAGIGAAERQILQDTLLKYTKTPDWKNYLEENMLTEAWMDGPTYAKWLEEWDGKYAKILKEMGAIK